MKKSNNSAIDQARKEIESHLRGETKDKITAVNKLFQLLKLDPNYSISKLRLLAKKTQPSEVRLYLAENMSGKGLKTKHYFDILKDLSDDPDEKLLEFLEKRRRSLATGITSYYNTIGNAALENFRFQNMSEMMNMKSISSVIDDLNRMQWKFMDDILRIKPPEFDLLSTKYLEPVDFTRLIPATDDIIRKSQSAIDDVIKKQRAEFELLSTKYLGSFTDSSLNKFLEKSENQNTWLGGASIFDSAKPLVSFIQLNDIALKPITERIKRIPSFYEVQELEPVRSPPRTPVTKKAKQLLAKLKNCEPGIENWIKFQDICMEIISYCLVPPLFDAMEQSETKDKSHRRDLIYNIPHGGGAFWTYLTIKYGLGIIIDCKNYKDPLKENEVLITSKYFGKEKLTTLGLIISRKGLSPTGLKAQQDLWKDQGKMLLCLDDSDMAKMLELKDMDDEPWKIIDLKEREFRSSL